MHKQEDHMEEKGVSHDTPCRGQLLAEEPIPDTGQII